MRVMLLILLFACNDAGIDPRVLTLPAFKMQLLGSNRVVNTDSIPNGKTTVLVYFDPDCQFSRQQTETIIRNHRLLQHVRFYMLSSGPLQKLHDFYRHYQLNRFENITMARDCNLFFEKDLKVPSFPWLFIYSPGKKLKRILTGSADVETMLTIING